jgi:SAM-dependent methyltransferase
MTPSKSQRSNTPDSRTCYTHSFYAGTVHGALDSARIILALLFEMHRPQSILDVGCGQGAWLAAAEELGCARLVGVDGHWVQPGALLSTNIEFIAADLERTLPLRRHFDLCISLEVAEHLSTDRAHSFVQDLCAASDLVLFSAAISCQGGTNHTNERWQSFWAELFARLGYGCYDLIRPVLWRDGRVESWYRQNALLYVKSSHPAAERLKAMALDRGPLDIVHPEIYTGNLETLQRAMSNPSLSLCSQLCSRWAIKKLQAFVTSLAGKANVVA